MAVAERCRDLWRSAGYRCSLTPRVLQLVAGHKRTSRSGVTRVTVGASQKMHGPNSVSKIESGGVTWSTESLPGSRIKTLATWARDS